MGDKPLIDGCKVLVTGASSGIGRATALAFARAGARLVATGRRLPELEKLKAELANAAHCPEIYAGDINDPQFTQSLVSAAGNVDVLVNCAGILQHAPFLDSEELAWRSVIDTNILSLLRISQLVALGMRERRRGHIFNVTSILARSVYPNTLVYAATKHAARAISDGLRLELGEFGIRVTEIAPGLVKTEVLRSITHPDVVKAYQARTYEGLEPETIAAAILFAAAQEPSVSTEVITINPMGQR